MTVEEIKKYYSAKTDADLARALGVTRQLVGKWKRRGWVPDKRAQTAIESVGSKRQASEQAS